MMPIVGRSVRPGGNLMKKYKLHWLGNMTEIVEGSNIADALNKSGYGAGALRALDYYEEIKE